MVNAQADALVRSERRDKPEWSLIYYEERMVLCDSQEAITMPRSAPATTSVAPAIRSAQLGLYWQELQECASSTDAPGIASQVKSRALCLVRVRAMQSQLWCVAERESGLRARHHNKIQQPLNDAQMLAAWLLSIKGAHNRMSIVSRLGTE